MKQINNKLFTLGKHAIEFVYGGECEPGYTLTEVLSFHVGDVCDQFPTLYHDGWHPPVCHIGLIEHIEMRCVKNPDKKS